MNIEPKPKPRVGIFTTFSNFRPEYSLCGVVRQQLIALVKYGYNPVLFVLDTFSGDEDVPDGVEVRKVIPQLLLEPYGSGDLSRLEDDVSRVVSALSENMADIDVCLTHDIIFINSFLPYNTGMRRAMEGSLKNVKWLHWMHSGPSLRPKLDGSPYDFLYTLPKNSRLVYMNHTDLIRAAEMYGVFPKDVRTIYNPMDIRELFNFHPLTRELIDAYDLLSPEIICAYPLSTTRMDRSGKQLSKVIQIMGEVKRQGMTVRLVVPNAHANADKEKQEIERMYQIAYQSGLDRHELVFTSLHDAPKHEHGVPHEVVRDLFLLGNLFIFPTVSENCPLVLLEAMASKNILVLNYSFPALRDFALENALYFRFGSLVDDPQYPDGENKYMQDIATLIISEYNNNKAIKANVVLRQKFNVDAIARRQLIPAIEEIYAE